MTASGMYNASCLPRSEFVPFGSYTVTAKHDLAETTYLSRTCPSGTLRTVPKPRGTAKSCTAFTFVHILQFNSSKLRLVAAGGQICDWRIPGVLIADLAFSNR